MNNRFLTGKDLDGNSTLTILTLVVIVALITIINNTPKNKSGTTSAINNKQFVTTQNDSIPKVDINLGILSLYVS